MKHSHKIAALWSFLALVLLIVGYIQQEPAYIYTAIFLILVSFYWLLFRDKLKMSYWSKRRHHDKIFKQPKK